MLTFYFLCVSTGNQSSTMGKKNLILFISFIILVHKISFYLLLERIPLITGTIKAHNGTYTRTQMINCTFLLSFLILGELSNSNFVSLLKLQTERSNQVFPLD